VELVVDGKDPQLIFSKDQEGRINSFNIGGVLKKIMEAQ
jgi:hypothetical protein